MSMLDTGNRDEKVIEGFGDEWSKFDQSRPELAAELEKQFSKYFSLFPWSTLPKDAVGFDAGCGSGRWAKLVAPRAGILHCCDPSHQALMVARSNLSGISNCRFHLAGVNELPFAPNSMDFGYSLGVLHHIPDTASGLHACVRALKPGAPFLVYLYYALDGRPWWFKSIHKTSDVFRSIISRLPFAARYTLTQLIAALVYYPLAKTASICEKGGIRVDNFPLSSYRHHSFYTMRTDALDRFGTRLEQRFSRDEIRDMMSRAGLTNIRFREDVPYWCALGFKAS
jgi:ubiquinone/menaquinone biosynthesis C-methylase UbiE